MSAAPMDITLKDEAWEGVDAQVQALMDRWLVPEGAQVQAGQPVARVILVKSSLDIAAPASGLVERVLVPAGETFGRGQPLAVLKPA
ncbi:MAG: biotin/lipoyl-containing protein [Polaromonas sp.]|uniref:biotin/lipoyl-containing protein n=1 Tax=Polaromonas sp. TaxID=1869339 RepID=UPI004034FFFD